MVLRIDTCFFFFFFQMVMNLVEENDQEIFLIFDNVPAIINILNNPASASQLFRRLQNAILLDGMQPKLVKNQAFVSVMRSIESAFSRSIDLNTHTMTFKSKIQLGNLMQAFVCRIKLGLITTRNFHEPFDLKSFLVF